MSHEIVERKRIAKNPLVEDIVKVVTGAFNMGEEMLKIKGGRNNTTEFDFIIQDLTLYRYKPCYQQETSL